MVAGTLLQNSASPVESQTDSNAQRASAAPPATQAQHIVSVHLEDWFQVGVFHKLIEREQWYRFDTRLERNATATLELLNKTNTKATFFVLGWVAEQFPQLVAEIARHGHEIACCDFAHRKLNELTPEQFVDDLRRSRDAVEAATQQRVLGFRTANGWIGSRDEWVLDVLAREGFQYDSSVMPRALPFGHDPQERFVHRLNTAHGQIWEVPPSTWNVCGLSVPIAGGNWFRQLPHSVLKRAVAQWDKQYDAPFVMYFHAWELDPEQPRISAVDRVSKVRHYRNLEKMRWVIEDYLTRYRFGTIAERLELQTESIAPSEQLNPTENASSTDAGSKLKISSSPAVTPTEVTVVIPCYNEEDTLPYLARTLERVEFELMAPHPQASSSTPHRPIKPTFLFVDDRSRDNTWEVMQAVFGEKSNCKLVRHEVNQGVSAAILTGIRHADTDIVCSMDCDCSYDPVELKRMIPLLTDGVDLVTASPYHPEGHVRNVPGWRLLLSKGLSNIYRWVLPVRLHTWTSCFRIYRKSAIEGLDLREHGFLGTAELVGELALGGSKIVEHPATLEVRIFGESKMKTWRTIRGHLGLIARFIKQRIQDS